MATFLVRGAKNTLCYHSLVITNKIYDSYHHLLIIIEAGKDIIFTDIYIYIMIIKNSPEMHKVSASSYIWKGFSDIWKWSSYIWRASSPIWTYKLCSIYEINKKSCILMKSTSHTSRPQSPLYIRGHRHSEYEHDGQNLIEVNVPKVCKFTVNISIVRKCSI